MKGCKNYGNAVVNITHGGSGKHYRFGGIAGSVLAQDVTGDICLENCENNGNLVVKCDNAVGATYLAGIAGVLDSRGSKCSVSGCVNTGKISMTDSAGFHSATAKAYVGGLVGQRNEGDVRNCTNTGVIDLTALDFDNVYAGGLVALQKAGYTGAAFQNCTVNADVKASFVNGSSTTANPLANAGMIIAKAADEGVTFGGAGDETIKVGGALCNGETRIAVTSDNVSDLVIGSACTCAPTFHTEVK